MIFKYKYSIGFAGAPVLKAFAAIHFSLHFGSSPWQGALSGECSRSCKFF